MAGVRGWRDRGDGEDGGMDASPFPELQPRPGRGQGNARLLPWVPLHCLYLRGGTEEPTEGRRHQQPGKTALLLILPILPILPPQPGVLPHGDSPGRAALPEGDLHQQPCIPAPLPHPKTPLPALSFAPLPTAGFKANRSSGLFLSQKHTRFPSEAKEKSIFQLQHAESQVPALKYLREERRATVSGSCLLQDSFSSVYLENISALRSHPARRSPARPPSA